jgi:hypothetical protein
MLYREINAVCSENRMKYIDRVCGQSVELLKDVAAVESKVLPLPN